MALNKMLGFENGINHQRTLIFIQRQKILMKLNFISPIQVSHSTLPAI